MATIGTWYNPITKQGYSGQQKSPTDIPADPSTGQPLVYGTAAASPTVPTMQKPATPAQPATQQAAQPATQPAAQPMATKQQPSSQPAAPITPATGGYSQPAQPAQGAGQQYDTTMPLDVFGTALNEMRTKLSANDDLMKQKATLLQHLYDTPLTPDQIKLLTPSQQTAVMSNNRNLIDMEVRLINDTVQGRASTLDTSIKYLTDTYQKSIENTEKQKSDAQTLVYQFVQQYGSNAGAALQALYGPDMISKLKNMGIDVDKFAAAAGELPTISEQRYGGGDNTGTPIVTIPQGTIAAQTNNPLNIKYSGTMAGLGAQDSGISATDGGTFSSFNNPEDGLQAGIQLLQQNYGNLTVQQAMNKWSNGSYGAEVSNLNPKQLISSLSDAQLQQLTSDMAQRESGANVDYSAGEVSAVPPDPITANNIDPKTGRTSGAIWNDAIQRAFEGTPLQQFVGGLSSTDPKAKTIKNQIDNTASAIVSSMGSSYPALKAMYKANASAATKFVTQALFVKTYMATATDNLDLALSQSNNLPRTNAKIANNYIQWLQGNFTPAGPLAEFETYIYTASREYAKVTSGGAMSAQGLTDSAQKESAKLLNAAQSPEAFASTVTAMKQDMSNVINELDKTVSGFSSTLGLPSSFASGTQNDTSSKSNSDLLGSIPGL